MPSPKVKILEIEKSLGFRWPNGMSNNNNARNAQSVQDLLKDIRTLQLEYVNNRNLSRLELKASVKFNTRLENLFTRHGPHLWPPRAIDRRAWLVDAHKWTWYGRYPRNLYYDYPEDHDM